MKKITLVLIGLFAMQSQAQEGLEDLLAAGIEDAQRFSAGYISPATEATMWNLSNGWIQSAQSKKPGKFEISVIGSAAFIDDEHKNFTLNTADYNNLQFRNGPAVQQVATAFGENDPEVVVFATVQNGAFQEEVEFILPQGLASVDVNVMPSAYLQGRIGLFKGAEVKVRYFPKVEQEDVKVGLIGGALQYEFTKLVPGEKILPVAVSGMVGYSRLNANYDFTDDNIIEGENQQFDLVQSVWTYQLQASTTMKIFNVYAGVGYVQGTSDFSVLGTYRVRGGIPLFETTNEFVDPFSIENEISGVRATVGAKLTLGFFGLHADYNLAAYNTATLGVHIGI